MLSMKKTEIPSHLLKFFKPRHVYKPKDDFMIPHRVYDALMGDGWYGRSDIVWHKLNTMPESVRDRPTKAHEYIFLLSKSANYYYDNDAIREPHDTALTDKRRRVSIEEYEAAKVGRYIRKGEPELEKGRMSTKKEGYQYLGNPYGRNKRSVWTVNTMPYSEAHFATFPPKLIEPMILAGTSPRACEHCGAPWERVISRGEPMPEPIHRNPVKRLEPGQAGNVGNGNMGFRASRSSGEEMNQWKALHPDITTGWQPTCTCINDGTDKCVVLEPFCGAGTVPMVSIQHHRAYIGIELNPEYVKLINERIETVQPVLWEVPA